MGDGLVLKKGQTWEKYASTINGDGSLTGTYVLEEVFEHFFGNFAYLRNTETDGVAKITQRWLYEGESRKPCGYWKLASE